jgi:hypothetical protein
MAQVSTSRVVPLEAQPVRHDLDDVIPLPRLVDHAPGKAAGRARVNHASAINVHIGEEIHHGCRCAV